MKRTFFIKTHFCILFFCLNTISILSSFGIKQSIEVTGRFLCKGNPLKDLPIQLMEEDVFSDDVLARGKTDKNGFFSMYGSDFELSFIDPFIAFKLECPKGGYLFNNKTINFHVPKRAFKYFRGHYEFFYDFGVYEANNITSI
ncbi:Transthyretin-like family-containing protein [Strongyloides ratti]|uniref:Transthyretin-like family-containing protein n=1 Tax=Strongyloides ratti TaxID=34506 RepID=A0A090LK76_STRRB|nr:Transthyretin-like family-containing protein [Strongyloides ratti]CEF67950.1 Transthyretin-like family-containing protein [Strongyloides ratti]